MTVMSMKESLAGRFIQEAESKLAGNSVLPDFEARIKRTGIVGISGIMANPQVSRKLGVIGVSEIPTKQSLYSSREMFTREVYNQGNIVRLPRKSRCDGMHDAEENPCGSPKCRTKGRQKLRSVPANPGRRSAGHKDKLKVIQNPFKKAA